jgi:hypothetical protein
MLSLISLSPSQRSWTWYFLQLCKAIGELPLLDIHSDVCKGLTEVVRDVFPHTERSECFKHLSRIHVFLTNELFHIVCPGERTLYIGQLYSSE